MDADEHKTFCIFIIIHSTEYYKGRRNASYLKRDFWALKHRMDFLSSIGRLEAAWGLWMHIHKEEEEGGTWSFVQRSLE